MRYYKRLLTSLLVISLLITGIPITSYADNVKTENNKDENIKDENIKDDGTGGGNTQIQLGGGDWGNDNNRSGLRFSLVDANDPTQVISVDGKGKSLVIDFIMCSEEAFNTYCGPIDGSAPSPVFGRKVKRFTNIKTQPLNTDTNEYLQIFLPEKLAQIKEKDPDSYALLDENMFEHMQWMEYLGDGIYQGMGQAINFWLTTNNKNEKVEDIWAQSGLKIDMTTVNEDGKEEKVNTANKEPNKWNTNKTNKDNKQQNITTINKNNTQKDTSKLYNIYVSSIGELAAKYKNGDKRKEYVNFMRVFESYGNAMNLYYSRGELTNAQWKDLWSRLKRQQESMARWSYGTGYRPTYEDMFGYNDTSWFDELFGVMTVYAAENEEEYILEDKVINSEETLDNGGTSHLGAILEMKDADGNYIFRTPSTLKNGEPLSKAEEDWRLIVEPIDWFTPYDITGKYPLSPYRFYGTISNIIDAMDSNVYGVNAQLKNGTQYHLNRRTFNVVSWRAMTLSDDIEKKQEMFNGNFMFKDADSIIKNYGMPTNRQLADWNKVTKDANGIPSQIGYGLHVYWINKKDPSLLKDGDSAISTWDKEKYTEVLPGPAPDASNKEDYPEETAFGELSKKFNIVKWYYIEYPEDKTEEVVDVTVRQDTPHIVSIVNEGTLDSEYYWSVDKWATGKEKILPQSGDKTKTYEQFCKSNPGDYIGTTPNILELEPEDKDQVLYVKLVLKQLPKKPTVVKIYETDGNTDKVEIEKNVEINNNRYEVTTEENEYKYVENVVTDITYTDEPTSWQDVPSGYIPDKKTSIITDSLTKVIYIKYERTNVIDGVNPVILHEDELAFPYSMDDLK